MPWSAGLDAEIPVAISRANYDRTRRNLIEWVRYVGSPQGQPFFGAPIDDRAWMDANLPLLAPPGAWVAKRPGKPTEDFVMNPRDYVLAGTAIVERAWTQEGLERYLATPAAQEPPGPGYWSWNYRADRCRERGLTPELLNLYGAVLSPETVLGNRCVETGEVPAHLNPDLPVVPTGSSQASGPYVFTSDDVPGIMFRPQGGAHSSPDWWYDTPWGREVVVTFAPPLVAGQFAWSGAVMSPIPGDHYVMVRYPHPYIVGMPEPDHVITVGSGASYQIGYAIGRGDQPITVGLYRSKNPEFNVVITGAGTRMGPRPETVDLGGGRLVTAWRGHYEDEEARDWYEDALDQAVATVARSAAAQMVLMAVGTVVSAGAAIPLIQAGLSIASNVGGGAIVDALAAEGVSVHGIQVGQTATSVGITPTGPVGVAIEAGAAAIAPTVAVAPVVAPEVTAQALAEVAKVSFYLELSGGLSELYTMAFRELVVRAQVTREQRDALRVKLATIAAELDATAWYRYGKMAVKAAQAALAIWVTATTTAVQAAGTEAAKAGAEEGAKKGLLDAVKEIGQKGFLELASDLAASLSVDMAKAALSAAQMALQFANAIELSKIVAAEAKRTAAAADAESAAQEAALRVEALDIEARIANVRAQLAAGRLAPGTAEPETTVDGARALSGSGTGWTVAALAVAAGAALLSRGKPR